MREKGSTNQVKIKVKLKIENEEDVLIFYFDTPMVVHIVQKDGINDLKKIFEKTLEQMVRNEVEFELDVAKDYPTAMYREVFEEYIADLNGEMKATYRQMVALLSSSDAGLINNESQR